MSRREDIDNAIWSDPDFEALSPNATLLYLWSFTNPRCGMAGLYKVSPRAMTESKVADGDVAGALDELAAAGFAFYEDSILWVRTRVKHMRSRSPQMAKAIASDVRKINPDHPLRRRFLETYGSDPWLRESLSETYRDPIDRVSKTPPENTRDSDTLSLPSADPIDRVQGSGKGNGKGRGNGSKQGVSSRGPDELPDDFPADLLPHARSTFRILRDLAQRHNAKAVSVRSLGSVVLANRHKPLVRSALAFVAWADGEAQPRRDVVAGYRNWLERTNDLAGLERLDDEGLPDRGGSVAGVVAPFRPRGGGSRQLTVRPSEEEERALMEEFQRRQMANDGEDAA